MEPPYRHVLILGCGYVGERMAAACLDRNRRVSATTRSAQRAAELSDLGINVVVAESPSELDAALLGDVDAVLDSIPLARGGDVQLATQPEWLPVIAPHMSGLRWAGYLSTTGVYGDAGGAWVDESWPCNPVSARGRERLRAEHAWLDAVPVTEVFRLAGIYGPGRNLIDRLKAGAYQAIRWQPPRFSNRIHVDDIVAALLASMSKPRDGRIVNLSDDGPLPHADYVTQLARMIGAPLPELLDPEQGEALLPSAAIEFFRDNKRVSNRRLHAELLPELAWPDFRVGLRSLL